MGVLAVVERDPLAAASVGLFSGFPDVELEAFVFQAAPEPFDADIVGEPVFNLRCSSASCLACK